MHDDPPITQDDLGRLTPIATPEEISPPKRTWAQADWDTIRHGHKSTDMDDKWHAYVEGRRLYLHRSWTGRGIYEAEFSQVQGGWRATSAVVEGDPTAIGDKTTGTRVRCSKP